ncbi:MAG: TraL conjugative transposon family protein [Prolixibacteraceae bacterium]|nr:TraL conjugative transposon family protein [Prolixibacteraceae bacterium]
MRTIHPGIGNTPMEKKTTSIWTSFQDLLKEACEKLTPKQHQVMVWTMLVVFTILVAVSITDIFRNGTMLSEPEHISPLEISEPVSTPNDTVSLKNH